MLAAGGVLVTITELTRVHPEPSMTPPAKDHIRPEFRLIGRLNAQCTGNTLTGSGTVTSRP